MKILLALNSFKGSCSSLAANQALKAGIHKINPKDQVSIFPMCDGGDGSLDVLQFHLNLKSKWVQTTDVLGKKIRAKYLWDRKNAIAYIELAAASGLARLGLRTNKILQVNTKGTGILIEHALKLSPKSIVLLVGGSATNDAGLGILDRLGVEFFDQRKKKLLPIPSNMIRIHSFSTSKTKLPSHVKLQIWTDVTNPFTGPQGAVAIYSKQKGASSTQQKLLEKGMLHFQSSIKKQFKIDIQKIKGTGAAGGVGGGLCGILGAEIQHGTHKLLELFQFDSHVKKNDLIFTGEGALDDQTQFGKLVDGVLKAAKKNNKPVIGVCGSLNLDNKQLRRLGFQAAFTLVPGPVELEFAKQQAVRLLRELGSNIRSMLELSYSSSSNKD